MILVEHTLSAAYHALPRPHLTIMHMTLFQIVQVVNFACTLGPDFSEVSSAFRSSGLVHILRSIVSNLCERHACQRLASVEVVALSHRCLLILTPLVMH